MKKLALYSAVAALGMCAMGAGAAPVGYESVNFHATLTVQNTESPWKVKRVSVSNKDLLTLVANEYTNTIPSGAQLVSYGLDDEEFAVLSANGKTVVIPDATEDAAREDDYVLELDPFGSEDTENVTGADTTQYTSALSVLRYENTNNSARFWLYGVINVTDNNKTDHETYNMANSSGYFNGLPVGGEEFGTMTGGVSGSGTVSEFALFDQF